MRIVTKGLATASYLYLMGLAIDEELPLMQHLSLLPATCKASPDDMIDSVMKYGSKDETDLGVLIAVLRKTTAQLRVVGEGKELAARVWNAQSTIVLLSALLNCELYWHVQSDSRIEDLSSCTALDVVLSSRLFIPRELKTINDSEKQWIRQHYRDAWELFDNNTRFETAVNSLWSYKQSLRPSVQMAIIWAGIESLFGVQNELVFRISTLAALFLGGGRQKQQEIKKLYSARSKAVHEGKQPSESCVSDSAGLLHALILECVERGCLPNENSLLFGFEEGSAKIIN